MIQVMVRNSTSVRTITTEVTSTPAKAFAEAGIDTSNAKVNLDGQILTATDMNSTFAALGVNDGSSVKLNGVVKADGANN